MNRCAVFMDGGYIDSIHKGLGSPQIDFVQLVERATENCPLLRVYYYNCLPYQSQTPTEVEKNLVSSKQRFFAAVSKLPYFTVREGKLAYRGHDREGRPILEQKRVDVMLATDLVMHSTKHLISYAILLAGDSDFIPAVEIAKNEGVNVHLYSVGGVSARPHDELIMACDRHTIISREEYLAFERHVG
ncbi:MAG: NYN domain-containing protein [Alicyclobacillaceae bacterium]|uniref:NYN domain-containing protein n=1 Tax=Alicyclobacillus sp. SP_1 TaxID=2942475 RepID=UPI002157B23A|nr:NYN domain-containing protein [Alicyclobacillus sp. SP_1]MCY0888364.1 NYN domain-containing protein [Alicyclobacillaceae bacterium]MCY0895724.1 NYN domain-containing protein [Alicyclobacillaceae bacterium]